ncbi:hypothetical protein B0H34DRAFT_768321 [Crassisporium funariophilum]|nr:hypothetical protein B0H34DRAFT_768321 [Crassisporium funariophilum]
MDSSWATQSYPGLPKPKMTSFESYNAKTTSISYPWPTEVNGVERIALSAQGDLQRVLSAFFARPIVIALVYSHTLHQTSLQSPLEPVSHPSPSIIAAASPDSPIVQTRQVHLQCNGKIVCTATSTVRITSPQCAHLFLQEKYAIGQMFRRLEKVPAFELKAVGLGAVEDDKKAASNSLSAGGNKSQQLWRKYTLIIPNFECEILEVFPSREMFLGGERWLTGTYSGSQNESEALTTLKQAGSTLNQGLKLVAGVGFLLVVAFEVALYTGRKC